MLELVSACKQLTVVPYTQSHYSIQQYEMLLNSVYTHFAHNKE